MKNNGVAEYNEKGLAYQKGAVERMQVKLETARLILTNYEEADLDKMIQLRSDPLVWRFSTHEVTNDPEKAKEYLKNILAEYEKGEPDFQALYLKDTGEYVGEAGILSMVRRARRAVIGYNLLSQYWGKGYATEITRRLVKHLYEQEQVERIEALVMTDNRASCRVLEKAGFQAEGLLRNFTCIQNQYYHVNYYGMISSDYQNTLEKGDCP